MTDGCFWSIYTSMKLLRTLLWVIPCFLISCAVTPTNNITRLNGNKLAHSNVIPVIRTTAYTQKEKDHLKYKNKTATGKVLKQRDTIAADWSCFPVHTQLRIMNHVYIVEDYGSALVKPLGQPPTVDVYQPSRSAMNAWGVKLFTDVEVVQWGDFKESAKILSERLKYKHCRTMYNRIMAQL